MTFARFPLVETAPADLPTFAVGDSFRFTNPEETWTVTGIHDGLIRWRSTRGASKTTAFDPFLPALEWSSKTGNGGAERLVGWKESLFPLQGGKKIAFQTARRFEGQEKPTSYLWKCYVGNARKVTVEAGTFPAYPVFCRRSDDFTVQSFYAPGVNGMLMITTRKRPAKARTRELAAFIPASGKRVAAPDLPALPRGWAVAPVKPPGPQMAVRSPTVKEPVVAPAEKIAPPPKREDARNPPGRNRPPAGPKIVAPTPAGAPAKSPAQAARSETPARQTGPSAAPPAAKAPDAKATAAARPSSIPSIAPPSLTARPAAAPAGTPPKAAASGSRKQPGAAGFGVQLASFSQPARATDAWPYYQKKLRPLLDNAPHLVRRVDLGPSKGVFHRLIAGPFDTSGQAHALCRSIRGRGGACLVTRVAG